MATPTVSERQFLIETAIIDAAAGPKSASVDGNSTTARDLRELIEADVHVAKKTAAASTGCGLKMLKIVNPGAV